MHHLILPMIAVPKILVTPTGFGNMLHFALAKCHVELQQPSIGESIHRFGGRLRMAIGVDLDVVTWSKLSVAVNKSLTPNCISLRLNSCRFNIHDGLAFFFGKSRVARESN